MTTAYHHGNLREALMTRAVQVLNTAGIEQLSLRALARELGVSHAAPLRHFQTKAELLSAIAIEGARSLLAGVASAPAAPTATARLMAISTAYFDWAIAHPAHYQVLRHPDVVRHAPSELSQMLEAFVAGQKAEILRAQSEGWRSDENPQDLFVQLTALTIGSAVVATDPFYLKASDSAPRRDQLLAAFHHFLDL